LAAAGRPSLCHPRQGPWLNLRFTVTTRGFSPDSGAPELTVSASARDFLLLLGRSEDPDTLFFSADW